ncbi:MAG TPA: mannosyltransferase family protein [Pyrinomonadaceae bacterium]|jgi:hypothetical protein
MKATHRQEAKGGGAHEESWLKRLDWSVVGLVLAVKAVLLVYAAHAFHLLANFRIQTFYGWLEIWNRWDTPHYLDIARDGYLTTGDQRLWIVFYPLYPWLVRVFSWLTAGDYLVAALLVSGVSSVAAALLLQRLALFDETEGVARRAVWFMLIFPTSYFLHIGYTESLFLALCLGSFVAARKERWLAAGLLGALAGLARVNGLLLIPALAAEAFMQWRSNDRRFNPQWLWIGLTSLGLACYLLLNKYVTGDAFAFQKILREHWHKKLSWPWLGIRGVAGGIWRPDAAEAQMVGVQELIFIALGFVAIVWCWRELRPSYAIWATLNWLLLTSTSFVLSSPRYVFTMFPIYFLFARLASARPVWGGVITVWSLLYLALFVGQFVQGRWAF